MHILWLCQLPYCASEAVGLCGCVFVQREFLRRALFFCADFRFINWYAYYLGKGIILERYGIIKNKNQREIVLLRGSGCRWRRCTFCDYHLDFSTNNTANYKINSEALERVTGVYGKLEVINSGSFCDLDAETIRLIASVCKAKGIHTLHFECHFMHRDKVDEIKSFFSKYGVQVHIKTGVETFDVNYRENIMQKGFGNASPKEIAEYADEVCLLFGLSGQTAESMKNDIETGLKYFDRVCVNIMNKNTTRVLPDDKVIDVFVKEIAPSYANNSRVDILMKNTDFGVGAEDNNVIAGGRADD